MEMGRDKQREVLKYMRKELQAEVAAESESHLFGNTSVAYFEGR